MRIIKIYSIILILVGLLIILSIFVSLKKDFVLYNINQRVYKEYDNSGNNNNVYGIIMIEKIKLKSIIYKIDNLNNNVNKSIYLAYDDINNLVFAAHSGNSLISYFKKLNRLKIGDTVEFIKDNVKRKYEIFNIRFIDKNGTYKLPKYNYPIISLITCSKSEKDKQLVLYGRLQKTEYSV